MPHFNVAGYILLQILTTIHPSRPITCSLTTYNGNDIKNAEKDCSEIILNGISVPAGITLQINLKKGAKLTLQGTLTWGYHEWDGPLMNITGTDVEIAGTTDHLLDGRGNLWWDDKGDAGGKVKPVTLVLHGLKNSVIHNINVKNPPYHAIWIEDSDGVVAEDVNVDSSDGGALGGKNTDGFNVWKSNNVTIRRIAIYNQDDCVAIKSGTNILVTDCYCSGGHGLSIGSIGGRDYNIVENVLISNSQILNSDNGVRIKTNSGTTGSVTNITYENIALKDINLYGIKTHGDYGHYGVVTGGVPIKEFILKNITGTIKETGSNVYIRVKNATDWHWFDIGVTGGKTIKECEGIPEGSNITCY